ncbi:MAG: FIG00933394: hypothetical protein, partial [uncultured Ramlibacter sp.]
PPTQPARRLRRSGAPRATGVGRACRSSIPGPSAIAYSGSHRQSPGMHCGHTQLRIRETAEGAGQEAQEGRQAARQGRPEGRRTGRRAGPGTGRGRPGQPHAGAAAAL